jgi:hypothetical protein
MTNTVPRDEQAYTSAFEYIYLLEYYKKWQDASPAMLSRLREDVRAMLLDEYDDLEGDVLAEVMDEALTDSDFPFERMA